LSYILEWQLVAHYKALTPAQGAVATAIARRILPGSVSERIPFRTLYAESIGVQSKETVKVALARLEELGVIRISKEPPGSRRPSVITWTLECPPECQSDHSKANTRLNKTRLEREREPLESEPLEANPEQVEDSFASYSLGHDTPQLLGRFKKDKKREKSFLISCIEKALDQVAEKTPSHRELGAALASPEGAQQVRVAAELLVVNATSPEAYLIKVATKNPERLLPRAPKAQQLPDLSAIPKALRAEFLESYQRNLEKAAG
jgi:hypothetical protein